MKPDRNPAASVPLLRTAPRISVVFPAYKHVTPSGVKRCGVTINVFREVEADSWFCTLFLLASFAVEFKSNAGCSAFFRQYPGP